MGNLNCFLALAYGIVDAVSKETRPIEKGTIRTTKIIYLRIFDRNYYNKHS